MQALQIIMFILSTNLAMSQEWRNNKSYRKQTGNITLLDGCWLKKDRIKQTDVWKNANRFNLSLKNGNLRYKTISQIRDFYRWFDCERIKRGHEISWIGIAGLVAGELSKLDNGFIRYFIVRNKDVVNFANEGSTKVLAFAFPQLNRLFFSQQIIKGIDAENWDHAYGMNEQCLILDSLYAKLSPKALCKLDRMAKGKGIFSLGVPKRLRYAGSIDDCKARYEHGKYKVFQYYVTTKKSHRLSN